MIIPLAAIIGLIAVIAILWSNSIAKEYQDKNNEELNDEDD